MSNGLKLYFKNHLFLLLTIILFIAYYSVTSRLPAGSTVFSRLLAWVVVPIVLWNIVGSIYDTMKEINIQKQANSDDKKTAEPKLIESSFIKKMAVLVFTFIYVFLIFKLGFYVCSTLYLAGILYFLGIRKPLNFVIYVISIDLFIFLTFDLWLHLDLPRGILI